MGQIALGLGNLPSQQAAAFGGAVCMGAGVALCYDLLRLFRLLWKGKVWGSLLDIAYWAAVTLSVLGYTVELTGGEVELYVAAAMLLGGWLYFRLLSPLVRRWEGAVAAICGKIWWVFTIPWRTLKNALKKFWKIAKKHFPFWERWFTITGKLGAVPGTPKGGTTQKGGGGWHEIQESGYGHEAAAADFVGSLHDHVPEPALSGKDAGAAAGCLRRGQPASTAGKRSLKRSHRRKG